MAGTASRTGPEGHGRYTTHPETVLKGCNRHPVASDTHFSATMTSTWQSSQPPPEVELYGRPDGREALVLDRAQEVKPLLTALGAATDERHGGHVGGAELDVLRLVGGLVNKMDF